MTAPHQDHPSNGDRWHRAERTDYPRDMAEIALAHNVGSEVERAYRRGDMLEKRRAMMAAWGRFLRAEAGQKVVRLGSVS
jgi:hypothetical protein